MAVLVGVAIVLLTLLSLLLVLGWREKRRHAETPADRYLREAREIRLSTDRATERRYTPSIHSTGVNDYGQSGGGGI
jgi:hypothetical protein